MGDFEDDPDWWMFHATLWEAELDELGEWTVG